MILMMAVYTYLNLRYFSAGEEQRKGLCSWQNRIMFLMHFLAYMIIYIKTEDPRMAVFYGAQVLFFMAYIPLLDSDEFFGIRTGSFRLQI